MQKTIVKAKIEILTYLGYRNTGHTEISCIPISGKTFNLFYQCNCTIYLSSLKLLLLNPPNTPFNNLPTTQHTSSTIITSSIILTFILLIIQLKTRKIADKTNSKISNSVKHHFLPPRLLSVWHVVHYSGPDQVSHCIYSKYAKSSFYY